MAESQQARTVPLPRRTLLLGGLGLLAFHLSHLLAGREEGVWLPALGVGLALTAWLGLRVVALLAIDSVLARLQTRPDFPIAQICLDGLLFAAQIGVSWWAFQKVAEGRRRLEDPHAATVFLILVPGVLAGLFALIQASSWTLAGITDLSLAHLAGTLWISRILGILTWTPFLLVGVTPYLVKGRVIAPDPAAPIPGGVHPDDWTWGEVIEASGLALGSAVLTLVVVALHQESAAPSWALWGMSLLLVVWASLRQGLRGGSFVAMVGGTAGLSLAGWQGLTAAGFSPLQGNILAQCSTALLVGASAGWIRASEARYRQVVGQIPVVLYSVRLPRGFTLPKAGQRRNRAEDAAGGDLVRQAEVTLVSPAARNIFRCEPDELLGPYARWLERIKPEDRELLLAALAQLSLQRQPVTCEYRLLSHTNIPDAHAASHAPYWLRDTLAPNYLADGTLSGWEGVIEDISEQRALSHTLRRTNSMFQALVTNLPTGVFFVQGPIGQPLLVNARARQLLGQREDNAAGIAHLSSGIL